MAGFLNRLAGAVKYLLRIFAIKTYLYKITNKICAPFKFVVKVQYVTSFVTLVYNDAQLWNFGTTRMHMLHDLELV